MMRFTLPPAHVARPAMFKLRCLDATRQGCATPTAQQVPAHVQGGGMMRFTPPPAHLARPEVLKGVRDRATMVADALGLNGVAQLDAFMHADSADLVLVNAHAIPDMSPASDIFQQWEATAVVQIKEVRLMLLRQAPASIRVI